MQFKMHNLSWFAGKCQVPVPMIETHKKDGYIELRPANPDYPVFKVDDPNEFQVWGTVIHLIRTFEKI